ncbi:MAG: hypothetical protein Q4E99_01065 [Bacillota bacterium]|nr:hypothetical protein [Bacillota bacterium]
MLQKEIGKEKAVACKRRWDQIKSFTTFGLFLSARLDNTEPLEGQLKGKYSITLTGNYRFIFAPNTKDCSPQNLKQITEFYVIGVMDYHGKGNKDNKWLIH